MTTLHRSPVLSPVAVGLGAYVAGILLSFAQTPLPAAFSLAAVAAAGCWLCWHSGRVTCGTALLLFGLGVVLATLQAQPAPWPQSVPAPDQPVVLEGRLQRLEARADDSWRALLAQVAVCREGQCEPLPDGLLLRGSGEPVAADPGDRLRFRARLGRPRLWGLPGEPDRPRRQLAQGVRWSAFVPRAVDVAVLAGRPGLFGRVEQLRHRLAQQIDAGLPPQEAALVRALAVGDRAAIDDDLRNTLSRTGLAHLVAISGLHVGIVAWLGYQLLLPLYRRSRRLLEWQPPQRVLPLVLIPLLGSYLLLAGDGSATRRAVLLACLAAAVGLWRRVRPLDLLAAVALLLLLGQPLALLLPSFQMSFAGAAGILLAWGRFQPLLQRCPRLLRSPAGVLLATLAATLATLPLVALHFHQLAPAGVVTNLFAVPLVSILAVPLALTGVLCAPWPALAQSLWAGAGLILRLTLSVAETLSHLPLLTPRPWLQPGWLLLPMALCCLFLITGSWRGRRLPLLGLAVLVLVAGLVGRQPVARPTLVTLSVGQGESHLLRLPGYGDLLIDGGGRAYGQFDVGERLLLPALAALDCRRLRAALLTHRHPDHAQGLTAVLRRLDALPLLSGEPQQALPRDIVAALGEGTRVQTLPPGWTQIWQQGAQRLMVYAPSRRQRQENDRSLAVYWGDGTAGLLLCGDLEEAGLRELRRAGLPGPVTLMSLPHHGDDHPALRQLLRKEHPQLVVASAGAGNRYGFPQASLRAWLEAEGIPCWSTDSQGTLVFALEGTQWHAMPWNPVLFH